MQRLVPVLLAAALVMAPLGAQAADLVVWWEKGYYAQEDAAVREIIAAFEQETGKQVELVLYADDELPAKLTAALEAGQPPDFLFGVRLADYIAQWAYDDRLVDLTDTVGHFSDLFDPDALDLRRRCSTRRPGSAASTRCRWGARPTTSTSGRACSSRPGSPSRTSPRSGRRSGRSGATRCSRRCAGPPAATTSGASA